MSTLRLIVQPLAIAVVLAFAVRASRLGIYSIPSDSMNPTLHVGDAIVVTPYGSSERPQRGDVVVFRSPSTDEAVVKRVIATPGDLIESRDGRVIVGGHALAEPYASAPTAAISPQVIPADTFFMLGDNRTSSYDSRQWGVIPRSLVVGRARLVVRTPGVHGLHLAALFKLVR